MENADNLYYRLFWLLLLVAAFLAIAYVYLINDAVLNIVERKEARETINSIGADLTMLESRYVNLTSTLTLERAYELGFEEAGANASFAFQGGLANLTLNR